MSALTREQRPQMEALNREAEPGGLLTIVPMADLDAEEFFRTSFAVLVRGKTVRRHLYFNLPAAERAVRRARERGDWADLILVELVPVAKAGGLDD